MKRNKKGAEHNPAPIQHQNHSIKLDGVCLILFIISFACMIAEIPNLKIAGAGIAFAVLVIQTHINLNDLED